MQPLCDLRATMPCHLSPGASHPDVTYGTLCHTIGHQVLPTPAFSVILMLLWTIARFLDPFYTFSPAHHRVIRDFTPTPSRTSNPGPTPTRFHPGCDPSPPLPRETEDFPRGDNHSKHVPLSAYLAWLQPLSYNSWFVFIHVKITEILLLVMTLIKKYRAAAKPISSQENIE